jgi:hypothetical protein
MCRRYTDFCIVALSKSERERERERERKIGVQVKPKAWHPYLEHGRHQGPGLYSLAWMFKEGV